MQNIALGFQSPEKMNEPKFLFDFLDKCDEIDSVRVCKQKIIDYLGIKEGDRVLDVGCGIGQEVQRIKQIVGNNGLVVGVDKSELMIEEAKKRADKLNLSVKYYLADANSLKMNDNSFDACRAERVLLFLENPKNAVLEMIRVLRPGGKLAIFDFYLDGTFVNSDFPALTRKIVGFISDSFPNGLIGCKLPEIFEELGLSNITFVTHTNLAPYDFFMWVCHGILEQAINQKVISESDLNQWVNQLKKMHESGHFLAGFPGFIVTGQKK